MASAELDREYHDIIGGEYDAVVVAPRRVINDIILGAAADLIKPGDRMIDVGCGTGHASLRLARKFSSVVAIDHSTAMLGAAAKNLSAAGISNVRLQQSAALDGVTAQMPASIDAAACIGFFHHLSAEDAETMLSAIRDALRPGGQLLISEPRKTGEAVPEPVASWNARAYIGQYSTFAEEPEEDPIDEAWLLRALAASGYSIDSVSHHWELFPSAPEPTAEDVAAMRDLHERFGANGNVVTVIASKA